jgi:DNA-binding CsgD family transcriptional regulator
VLDDLPESTGRNRSLPWYIKHLVRVREELLDKTQGIKERICQEVAAITQQRARLIFLDRQQNVIASLPPSVVTFPVCSDGSYFGILAFQQKPSGEDLLDFSLDQMREIADMCGWMLSTLKFRAFIQRMGQTEKLSLFQPLSKRERQVLQLMDRSEEAIAQALGLTVATVRKHKESIRAKLGADDDTKALLIAYDRHLYFPLEDIISRPVNKIDLPGWNV